MTVFAVSLGNWSPGELSFGLTPEQLKKPHDSRPWNPLMANVFYKRDVIETWGRGTLKIMDLMDKADLPAPEFMSEAGHFTITFCIPEEKRLTPLDARKSNSCSKSAVILSPGKKFKINSDLRIESIFGRTT